ncbi:MAG: Cytochrome c class, partial [Frankiales bacterium]|nr:Cytochrome c class [Frankiales bacterium]
MTAKMTFAGIALALVLPQIAAAQEAPPALGRRLVQADCIRCHATELGAKSNDPGAPNLAEVARMPSVTDLSLRVFLRSSHRSMPNVVLSEDEISSVIAYIRSMAP